LNSEEVMESDSSV